MAKKININKVGLTFGIFMAIVHTLWSILIALHLAKPYLDWILHLHSVEMQVSILDFNILRSLGLISITFIFGYLFGMLFSLIWNCYKK